MTATRLQDLETVEENGVDVQDRGQGRRAHWTGERAVRRACAGIAGACAVFAAVAIGIATAATGTVYGYVSEAGAPGAPLRGLYRAGVYGVAIALAFFAAAIIALVREEDRRGTLLRSAAPGSPSRWAGVSRWAVGPAGVALAFAAAAPLAATSGAVSCTPGCPLPPFESPSQSDIVHALASIGGFGLATGAMLLLAIGEAGAVGSSGPAGATAEAAGATAEAVRTRDPLRAASRVSAGLLVPLLAITGLVMLVTGRGLLAGLLERAALGVALGWLVTAAVTVTIRRPPDGAAAGRLSTAIRRRT